MVHRTELLDPDAVLAGERTAGLEARAHDLLSGVEDSRQLGFVAAVVGDVRVQVAVARVEHVGQLEPALVADVGRASYELAQLGARNDDVGDVQVRGDAAHRAEGSLAAGPQALTLVGVAPAPQLECAVRADDGLDGGGHGAHLDLAAFDLDQQHGPGVAWIAGGVDAVLDGVDRQLVEDLDRRRLEARGDDLGDRVAGGVEVVEDREQRLGDRGHGGQLDRDLGRDAEHTLASGEEPDEVVAVGIDRGPSEVEQLALRRHDDEAQDVPRRRAVAEAVGASGVVRDVAADRAGLLRRGVGRVEQAMLCACGGQVDVDHAGLDAREAVLGVDLQHVLHARGREHDAAFDRRRAAGQAGPRAARDDRDPGAMQDAHGARRLVGRARQEDQLGTLTQHREPVGLVGHAVRGPVDDTRLTDDRAQLVDQAPVHGADCRRSAPRSRSATAATRRSAASRRRRQRSSRSRRTC